MKTIWQVVVEIFCFRLIHNQTDNQCISPYHCLPLLCKQFVTLNGLIFCCNQSQVSDVSLRCNFQLWLGLLEVFHVNGRNMLI